MSWNPNSKKHKANHCGYKRQPSRKEVKAAMDFFDISDIVKDLGEINLVIASSKKVTPKIGTQLKLDL